MTDSAQVIIATAAMGFSLWYFFFGPGHTSSGDQARPPGRRRQVPASDVQRVCDTFPTISPAAARYDLEKTGSVEATCNNYLERGFLQEPPPGYYEEPAAPAPAARPIASSSVKRPAPLKFRPPTLIEKLGLQDRILEDVTNMGDPKANGKAWAAAAEDRESLLKLRKENMVLEARRKLLEKNRKGKAPA